MGSIKNSNIWWKVLLLRIDIFVNVGMEINKIGVNK